MASSRIRCRGPRTTRRRSWQRVRVRGAVAGRGFRIESDEDRTAAVAGPPAPGSLTPGALFGPGFAERIGNNIAATMNGILAPVLIVAGGVVD